MRTVSLDRQGNISGMTINQVMGMNMDFAQYDAVRRLERWSIREFMRENAGLLTGRVLDYGCGDMPYRDLVTGDYLAYDPVLGKGVELIQDPALVASNVYDAIMCNQVTQYVTLLGRTLRELYHGLKPGGHFVMTFATNWDEVEDTDQFRYTAKGMQHMLYCAGFIVVKCERRAEVTHGAFKFPLGYGIVAQKADVE